MNSLKEGQAAYLLQEALENNEHLWSTEFTEAIELGIKALRRENKYRKEAKRYKRKFLEEQTKES